MQQLISKPELKMLSYKSKNIQLSMIQKRLQQETNGREDITNKKIAFRFKCKNTKNLKINQNTSDMKSVN